VSAPIAAAEGGIGALAHFAGGQRRDERQTATRPFGCGLGCTRRALRRSDGAGGGATGAAAECARAFFFLGLELRTAGRRADGGRCRGRCGRCFAFAETLLGDFVGLALGFVVVLAAIVFVALASFGGVAFDLLNGVALGADLRLFLGDLAFFGLAQTRITKRMGAAVTLFVGQRAENDTGRLRSRRSRSGCSGFRRCATGGCCPLGSRSGRSRYRGSSRSGRCGLGLGVAFPTLNVLPSGVLVSAITSYSVSVRCAACAASARVTGPKALKTLKTRQKRVTRGPG
jgi:hypothetical protein